jgi:hypothetical protein
VGDFDPRDFLRSTKVAMKMEPTINGDWENLYVCFGCRRIINGQNPNPKPLE